MTTGSLNSTTLTVGPDGQAHREVRPSRDIRKCGERTLLDRINKLSPILAGQLARRDVEVRLLSGVDLSDIGSWCVTKHWRAQGGSRPRQHLIPNGTVDVRRDGHFVRIIAHDAYPRSIVVRLT